jgi:hypothetical protein
MHEEEIRIRRVRSLMEEPEEEMVVVETMEVPRPESRSLWQKIGMVALGAVLFALPWLVSGGFPDVVTIPKLAFLAVACSQEPQRFLEQCLSLG